MDCITNSLRSHLETAGLYSPRKQGVMCDTDTRYILACSSLSNVWGLYIIMASASQALLSQLGELQSYLVLQRSVMEEQFHPVMQQQMEMMIQRLGAVSLTASKAREFIELIGTGPWLALQRQQLCGAVNRAVTLAGVTGSSGTGRRPNQSVRGFAAFLTVKDVEILRSKAALHIKCDCIVTRLLTLGLHLPSEARVVAQTHLGKHNAPNRKQLCCTCEIFRPYNIIILCLASLSPGKLA